MLVSVFAMASPIFVRHAISNLMFHVVWSQRSLPTLVMSTDFFSLAFQLIKIVTVVILKFSQYFVVPFVNLH